MQGTEYQYLLRRWSHETPLESERVMQERGRQPGDMGCPGRSVGLNLTGQLWESA